jgi:hypothetical protein
MAGEKRTDGEERAANRRTESRRKFRKLEWYFAGFETGGLQLGRAE